MRKRSVRAARGMLDWRQARLAKQSNLSLSTLKDFEAERRTPAINNLAAIQTALENGGIRFVTGDWNGGIAITRASHGDFGAIVVDPGWPAGVKRV